ncbi:hypothetical protein BRC92_12335 [Halobacteriales archaeon QS_4_69_31]|nr:MAG: hypothetical protein BRC92_12335 [Halobacteriales archaeon QS_4_69_31]
MSGGEEFDGDDGADARSAKWRCAWCEKPHDRNDPPCDNCGHHKFERAVVPVAPDVGEDYQREPVWVCPECGRQHQKNSPPCSRCGHPNLEKHVPEEVDFADELGGTSYVDLLEPGYVAGFAVALVALGVLVLAVLGVVTLPGMGGPDLTVEGVPGSADTVDGVDLAAVEAAYLDRINDRREAAGRDPLARNDRLDEVSRFATQRRAKSVYGDGQQASGDRLANAAGDACDGEDFVLRLFRVDVDPDGEVASADAVADTLVDGALAGESTPVGADGARTGLDAHAGPDGRVFLSQLVC